MWQRFGLATDSIPLRPNAPESVGMSRARASIVFGVDAREVVSDDDVR